MDERHVNYSVSDMIEHYKKELEDVFVSLGGRGFKIPQLPKSLIEHAVFGEPVMEMVNSLKSLKKMVRLEKLKYLKEIIPQNKIKKK